MKLKNLKRSEMIKIAVAVTLLFIAGFYLIAHLATIFGRPTSNAVAFYQVFRPAGINPRRPVSANNPVDPSSKFASVTYKFADARGTVDVISYPHDATRALEVRTAKPGRAGRPPWLGKVKAISDPVRQALMFAQLRGPWLMRRWLLDAHLNAGQMQSVALAQQQFRTSMNALVQSEQQGLIDSSLLDRLKKRLKTFLTDSGSVSKAGAKRRAARKVIALGRRYAAKIQLQRTAYLTTYLNAVIGQLTDQEKSVLAARITPILRRFN